jgi:ABC-2 type transport system permease protein
MLAIIRKELADFFNSARFFVLFLLILVASGFGIYAVQQGIRAALEQSQAVTEGGFIFLVLFTTSYNGIPILTLAFDLIIPIAGIVLAFDAINSERTGRTMSRLLAQPIYRDGIINGKFIAGIVTLALMVGTSLLLISGFGLRMIGVPPTADEIIRLFIYFVITIVYGAFWMSLAMLASTIFRRSAGSLLIPIVIFLILYFFWVFLGFGQVIAAAISPVDTNADVSTQLQQAGTQETLLRLSPSYIFQEAYVVLLAPMWKGLGIITYGDLNYMLNNPLSLGQSLLEIWPHIVVLISLSVVFFAISYVVFMKQEIRAT